ncbi:MAG: glycosyltransferase [Bacteroidetes bacterium]|nr:glycosyltransferase [Bacteroidota bacterium]
MRKPNILMLGWEFPPVINGGLGIACHDLSVALTEFANVNMIIPKAIHGAYHDKLNVIGLNNIDVNSLKDISRKGEYNSFEQLYEVPVNLEPYYSEDDYKREGKAGYITEVIIAGKKFNVFDIDNLYGGDIMEKVRQFANIATKLSENIDFDVIHCHDWMTMIAGMAIKAKSGRPLVMHIHSLEVDRSGPESKGWLYGLEKLGMETADLLFPVSHFTGENIVKYYGISREKIVPVHNGIRPVDAFKTLSPYNEKTVLFVGRLTKQKGPEFFLDIASKVLKHRPDVRFVVAGAGEHFKKMLFESSYSNIGNRFHLTGFINQQQLRKLLSFTDVYLMPSVSEPFGLSAVEAAQFQVPCVISKQSGVAEVLPGSLKFDFWDIDKAADYVLNLLNDQVLNQKVINDANENLKNICWTQSAKKVVDQYRNFKIYQN